MVPTRQQGAPAPGLNVCATSHPIPEHLQGAVVAIGNFDGVHRGHRQLIETANDEAARRGTVGAILTFDPHPRAYFRPDLQVFRLTPWAVKLKLVASFGIATVFVQAFDAALAGTSAAAFVEQLLVERLGASSVVVGEDFHFGRGREGTPAILRELAALHGLGCILVPPVTFAGETVSSSLIRKALEEGDAQRANRLLGYRWFVEGEVVHGHKRGRELGFPTANVVLDPGCRLRHGIYAVRVAVEGQAVKSGVASFGRRPTFDDGAPLLEVFLFDFAGDLYGQRIGVEFLGWVRGEEKFASADDLVVRMNADSEEARAIATMDDGLPSYLGAARTIGSDAG